MKRIALVMMVVAGPAGAQSETTCFEMGGTVHCHSQPASSYSPPPIINQMLSPDAINGYQRGQGRARQRAAPPTPQAAEVSEPTPPMFSRAQLIQDISTLVARGQCDTALGILRTMSNQQELFKRTIEVCLATSPPHP